MTRNRAPSGQTRKILSVLMETSAAWRHGYDLAKMAGLRSGTMYPALIRLHDRGLLEARWEEPVLPGRPARHAYRLSATGLAFARSLAEREAAAEPVGKAAFA